MSLDNYPLISDWLRVADGRLVIRTGKVDIGQRISSALVQIVRDELGLPLDLIEVAPVTTDESPDEGVTSGSNSIEQSGRAIRLAAATLRVRSEHWAAEQAGDVSAPWRLEDGALTGPARNEPLPLLDLIEGRDLAIPVDVSAELARVSEAPSAPMLGMSQLVTGEYRFLHDIVLPGMLHARVIRPPHMKARLKGVSEETCKKLEGEGLSIMKDGSFLAVAGQREWPVVRGALRVSNACEWDTGPGLPEGDVFELLTQENAQRFVVLDGTPHEQPIPDALEDPGHSARYERPFTMHGALGPSAALAIWRDGSLHITTHSQGIYPLRETIADSLNLALDKVVLSHAPGSGCYGHNGADDAAFEAALIAMALPDTPVLLKWSRDDEHCWEPYGTAMAVELDARVTDGKIAAWSAESIGGTFRGRPRPGPNRAGPSRLIANWLRSDGIGPNPAVPNFNRQGGLQRNLDPIYRIPEARFVKNLVREIPLRTSALRCLGAAPNVFAIECFMDELALAEGADPLSFRRQNLEDTRAIEVIDRLERELRTRPRAQGRGVAYAQYKNEMTRVGIAVDIDVSDRADIRLKNVLIVADAGRVIDRDGLIAQLEGGFLQGASWALYEETTWDRDGITSRDWDSYPVLRFDNIPQIETILLDRPDDPPRGAGEASPGPTLAAIANALYDATGLRLRRLPMTADAIARHALQ